MNLPLDLDFNMVLRGLAKRLKRRSSASSVRWEVRSPFNWDSHFQQAELDAWLQRIRKYSLATPQAFVMAISYIERAANLGLPLNPKNVHYVVLLCISIASKYLDDKFVSNRRYSQIGNIDLRAYNQLEGVLLNLLDFDLSCSPEVFAKYMNEVQAEAESRFPLGQTTVPVAPPVDLRAVRVASSEDVSRSRSNSCGQELIQDIVAGAHGRSDLQPFLVSA